MADFLPRSQREAIQINKDGLEALIESGAVKPFFFWFRWIFICLPVLGLMIPRRGALRYVRSAIFVLIVSVGIHVFQHRRALVGANGYGIGLMSVWWMIWSATLLVFNNAEDFKRIERRLVSTSDARDGQENDKKEHGTTNDKEHSSQKEIFVWQGYPESFLHRLNWALGLLFNMRGPEWNWRISHLGPLPPSVRAQLGDEKASSESSDSDFPTAREQLNRALKSFFKSYLALDVFKVLVMRDPYFWSGISSVPPSFPFSYLAWSPMLVRIYRLAVSSTAIYTALTYVTSLNPIIFLGLSLAFPNASRTITSAPLDAPWLYSHGFGPFISTVLDDGLAGCWSRWWHQLFRFGFTSTGHWILSLLPSKVAKNPTVKGTIIALAAFSVSGSIHASGSYTQHAVTKPLSGTFLFFAVQAVGIIVQNTLSKMIVSTFPSNSIPQSLRRTGNAAFVFWWFYLTGGLVADDFARGGVWLTEPLPVSILRGLDIGVKGEGWWCWKEPWFREWSDGTWWNSGLRLL